MNLKFKRNLPLLILVVLVLALLVFVLGDLPIVAYGV